MAFFEKADAKVRTFFELPKLFEVFFEKSFFSTGKAQSSSLFQYFNSSRHLSRLRVQKYCFITYLPNMRNTFFALFCKVYSNLLIFRYAIKHKIRGRLPAWESPPTLILYVRVHTRIITWTILLHTG